MKEKTLYKTTQISPERTKADIDKMLKDFGIGNRGWITKDGQDILFFEWQIEIDGVYKKLTFQLSPPDIRQTKRTWDPKLYRNVKVNVRNDAIAYRLLFNYIKNKLEAIRVGMVTVENEFMSHIKLSLKDGSSTTMGNEFLVMLNRNQLGNALEYTPQSEQKTQIRNVTPVNETA